MNLYHATGFHTVVTSFSCVFDGRDSGYSRSFQYISEIFTDCFMRLTMATACRQLEVFKSSRYVGNYSFPILEHLSKFPLRNCVEPICSEFVIVVRVMVNVQISLLCLLHFTKR